jgi:hypothetical protein
MCLSVRTCVPVRSRGPGYIVLKDRYPSSVAISLSSSRNILSPPLNIYPVSPIPNTKWLATCFCYSASSERKLLLHKLMCIVISAVVIALYRAIRLVCLHDVSMM